MGGDIRPSEGRSSRPWSLRDPWRTSSVWADSVRLPCGQKCSRYPIPPCEGALAVILYRFLKRVCLLPILFLLSLLVLGCHRAPSRSSAGTEDAHAATTAQARQQPAASASGTSPEQHSPSGTPEKQRDGLRIFFVGNSFTRQGPVPDLVQELARHRGLRDVVVDSRAVNSRSLEWHRADTSPEGAPARIREGWDVVVLQELSTRPTDGVGPAEGFKRDAAWFYDRAKEANPQARVILYETWARRAGHPIYDSGYFASPAQMQRQLRDHYTDAAKRAIPLLAKQAPGNDVVVAPVGDAWELQLGRSDTVRLHGPDDYHAGPNGRYLNALVLFSTIFHQPARGLPAINVTPQTATMLQATADAVTGFGRPIRLPQASVQFPAA